MKRQDHATMLQWLDEELDLEFDPSRSLVLETHLKQCADCRREKERSLRLRGLLAEDRVEVAPGFTARVMAALPVASWEARPVRSLGLAIALLLLLASSSALLLSASGAAEGSPFSLLGSIADLLTTSMLAGAGLLGASWRGIGLVLQGLLTGSPATLMAFAATLVGVHLLLWRLMRPRQKAHAPSGSADPPRQGG